MRAKLYGNERPLATTDCSYQYRCWRNGGKSWEEANTVLATRSR